MFKEPSEEQLMAALAGDPCASHEVAVWIMEASKPMVHIRLVHHPDRIMEAEDLIQQVCLGVLRALPKMRRLTVESTRGLISTIVERRVRDLLRRSRRTRETREIAHPQELLLVDSIAFGGGLLLGVFGGDRSPSSSVRHRDAIARLLDLVSFLRKSDRELLILIFWDGLSTAEVAVRLKKKRTAVANQLHRVLESLHAAWKRRYGAT